MEVVSELAMKLAEALTCNDRSEAPRLYLPEEVQTTLDYVNRGGRQEADPILVQFNYTVQALHHYLAGLMDAGPHVVTYYSILERLISDDRELNRLTVEHGSLAEQLRQANEQIEQLQQPSPIVEVAPPREQPESIVRYRTPPMVVLVIVLLGVALGVLLLVGRSEPQPVSPFDWKGVIASNLQLPPGSERLEPSVFIAKLTTLYSEKDSLTRNLVHDAEKWRTVFGGGAVLEAPVDGSATCKSPDFLLYCPEGIEYLDGDNAPNIACGKGADDKGVCYYLRCHAKAFPAANAGYHDVYECPGE